MDHRFKLDWVQDPGFSEAEKIRDKFVHNELRVDNLSYHELAILKMYYQAAFAKIEFEILKASCEEVDPADPMKNMEYAADLERKKLPVLKEEKIVCEQLRKITTSETSGTDKEETTNMEVRVSDISYDNYVANSSNFSNANSVNNVDLCNDDNVEMSNDLWQVQNSRKFGVKRRSNDCKNENINVKYQRNNIASYIPTRGISLNNTFGNLSNEVNLNDNAVAQNSNPNSNQNSNRINPPKVRSITAKINDNSKILLKDYHRSGHCNFNVTQSGEFIKIFPKTPADYQKLTAKLDELSIQHYLFPEKSTYPLKCVIRGLPIDMTEKEIEDELKALNFPVTKVSQMVKFKNKNPMPLFQIQLDDTKDARKIFELEDLSYFKIKIENYRRPSRTIQCFKCQYYHHTSKTCNMTKRCVICGKNHGDQKCGEDGEKVVVKCCNCGAGHVASYRGCPKFPENKKKFNSNFVSSNISFAKITAATTSIQNSTEPPSHQNFPPTQRNDLSGLNKLNQILNEIAKQFNVNNFEQLISKFENLLHNLKSTNNFSSKINMLQETLNDNTSLSP